MNLQLNLEAWIALGCLAGVVLLSGIVLWGAWRRGMRPQRRTPPADKMEGPSFLHAWEKEDAQFAELSRRVEDLRAHLQEKSNPAPPEERPPGN